MISGINFRIDLKAAKQKYFGCFNNIKSVIQKQADEIMLLKLIKTYCLPRLLYGCEIWPTETLVQFSSVQFARINVVLSAKHFRTTTQCDSN